METLMNMVESIKLLPTTLFLLILAALVLLCVFVTWKVSLAWQRRVLQKDKAILEDEHFKVQKGLKQIFDAEKKEQVQKVEILLEEIETLKQRIEDYRRKIAGLGVFSFLGSSKKRSDILYSLLLENEMLEQLLLSQSERIIDQSTQHLKEKIIDIGKRQRLMSEIFNDEKIKGYVEEVLATDLGNLKKRIDVSSNDDVKKILSRSELIKSPKEEISKLKKARAASSPEKKKKRAKKK